jgi:hypothetical protein
MPIEYRIDHLRRLVLARGRGALKDDDVFTYQREVWSRPDVAGYDELIDMTEVRHMAVPSADRVQDLAHLSARMDTRPERSRLAIVAPFDTAFDLGRMYQAFREQEFRGTKLVGVFRTLSEAFDFLGIEADLPE